MCLNIAPAKRITPVPLLTGPHSARLGDRQAGRRYFGMYVCVLRWQ